MTKKFLSRDDILTANDLPTRDVPVPEWGGTVRVSAMTAAARDAIEAAGAEARRQGRIATFQIRARYAAACIVGEDGAPMFSSDDVEKLGRKSAAALDRVFEAVSELNHLKPDDVEAIAKN